MKMIRTARIAYVRFGTRESITILLAQVLSLYNLYRGALAYWDPAHTVPLPISAAMVLMNGFALLATVRSIVRWRRAGRIKRAPDSEEDLLIAMNV